MKRERALQKAAVDFLTLHNFLVFSVPNEYTRKRRPPGRLAGACDLIAVAPSGEVLFIELKTPQGRLTWRQKRFAEELMARGRVLHVVRSLDELMALVREGGFLCANRVL